MIEEEEKEKERKRKGKSEKENFSAELVAASLQYTNRNRMKRINL